METNYGTAIAGSNKPMPGLLLEIASSLSSEVEKRLFAEYGAIFVTTATPPPAVILADKAQVEEFQSSLTLGRSVLGEYEIELQTDAIEALSAAASEIAERNGRITARAADAGARSYEDTVSLWTRNVKRGLEHWRELGRISSGRARAIQQLTPAEQIEAILKLEDSEQLFFGTFFDKSILYSVAAPGASQHLSMLAFDVSEYEDPGVDRVLGGHGWYRTVPNDLPHFTYLGREQDALPGLGLKRTTLACEERVYDFWIPDLERLKTGHPTLRS
jgi:hypothetical protein